MIYALEELNNVVTDVANRIISLGTSKTSSGNYVLRHDDVADLISEEDYLQYFDFILSELYGREEILDIDTPDHEFDCNFGLDYCPNYCWSPGDEEIFGCSESEWEQTFLAKPAQQRLSMTRLSEIGENGIAYVLETSDIALEDLTERLGMSMEELEKMGIYEAANRHLAPDAFILDDELCVQDNTLDCIDGYLWATDPLVQRLQAQESPESFACAENINFYAVYQPAAKDISLEGTYWTRQDGQERQIAFKLPLTQEEAAALSGKMEAYSMEKHDRSCLDFLNELRKDVGKPCISSKIPLDAQIRAASEGRSQNPTAHSATDRTAPER